VNRCPITYVPCQGDYSPQGLRLLSPKLAALEPLPFDAEGLRREALLRADKMSVQGVQPKLSARLEPSKSRLAIVDSRGRFILKPQSAYPELPENEDLSMRLAAASGIEVPLHGMVYAKDRSLTYFIQRFDRVGRTGKLPVEDFAQLAGRTRDTKYDFSMEQLVPLLEDFCTFPAVEKRRLFERVIFNFLIGNEDMHLKNHSLLTRDDVVALAPAYDFVNTTIVLRDPVEIALPLGGKQRGLTRRLLVEYWGHERLGLPKPAVDDVLAKFARAIATWRDLIERSFLSDAMQEKYLSLVEGRRKTLGL
jgi:serine/threonine-protein kinase HipA